MRISTQIKKLGTGYYILIPASIRNIMDLKEKDIVEVDITKILDNNDDAYMKDYKCLVCEHRFTQNLKIDGIVYCPSCNNENMDAIEEVE